MIRRRDTQLTLTNHSDIGRFMVSASAWRPGEPQRGGLGAGRSALGQNTAELWLTWWMGDALGAMIAAPITLTPTATPPEARRSRRHTVARPCWP